MEMTRGVSVPPERIEMERAKPDPNAADHTANQTAPRINLLNLALWLLGVACVVTAVILFAARYASLILSDRLGAARGA